MDAEKADLSDYIIEQEMEEQVPCDVCTLEAYGCSRWDMCREKLRPRLGLPSLLNQRSETSDQSISTQRRQDLRRRIPIECTALLTRYRPWRLLTNRQSNVFGAGMRLTQSQDL